VTVTKQLNCLDFSLIKKGKTMKSLILAAAMILAAASGTLAQTSSVQLSSAIESQILQWIPDADLSSLTTMQYAQIVSLFASSDNLRTGNHPAGQVKIILNAQ
jgi:hypothetical protein